MALSTTDFLTCIVVPITFCIGILSPKEEQCYKDHNITFCQTDYYKYNRAATMTEKVVGSVTYSFIFNPLSITSVLAMSRWYQISYPLRPLNRTAIEMFLAVLCIFHAIYFPWMILSDSPEHPTAMRMNIQAVWHETSWYGEGSHPVPIEGCVAMMLICLSTIASSLTVWNVLNSQEVSGNLEIRARKIRSANKILLLNVGNAVSTGVLLGVVMEDNDSEQFLILQSVVVTLPVLLSTYNPVIYSVLTVGILDKNFRVGGVN